MLMGGFYVALLVGMVYADESTQIQPAPIVQNQVPDLPAPLLPDPRP